MTGIGIVMFSFSFAFGFLEPLAVIYCVLLAVVTIADTVVLYSSPTPLRATRSMSKMLSLSDENEVRIEIVNTSAIQLKVELFDELPYQLQIRNNRLYTELSPGHYETIKYYIRPVIRGEYDFGYINAFASGFSGLVARKILLSAPQAVPVYPSIIQMKKYELLAFARISTFEGIKHVRRVGHSYEFEKIRQYNQGDDLRTINWKATGRRNQLMVNQYEDERAQQIYSIIDKSRVMHMPFNGLSLLDYAINTSLVISNVALKKYDKAGLISYSHLIGTALPAESSSIQLKKILQALYHEKPQPFEANYDLLY